MTDINVIERELLQIRTEKISLQPRLSWNVAEVFIFTPGFEQAVRNDSVTFGKYEDYEAYLNSDIKRDLTTDQIEKLVGKWQQISNEIGKDFQKAEAERETTRQNFIKARAALQNPEFDFEEVKKTFVGNPHFENVNSIPELDGKIKELQTAHIAAELGDNKAWTDHGPVLNAVLGGVDIKWGGDLKAGVGGVFNWAVDGAAGYIKTMSVDSDGSGTDETLNHASRVVKGATSDAFDLASRTMDKLTVPDNKSGRAAVGWAGGIAGAAVGTWGYSKAIIPLIQKIPGMSSLSFLYDNAVVKLVVFGALLLAARKGTHLVMPDAEGDNKNSNGVPIVDAGYEITQLDGTVLTLNQSNVPLPKDVFGGQQGSAQGNGHVSFQHMLNSDKALAAFDGHDVGDMNAERVASSREVLASNDAVSFPIENYRDRSAPSLGLQPGPAVA